MAHRPPEHCVLCDCFRIRKSTPPGHGQCTGYDKLRRHDDTNEACPLWKEAANRQERRAWAEQQPKETT
jgi:hypothetical protein